MPKKEEMVEHSSPYIEENGRFPSVDTVSLLRTEEDEMDDSDALHFSSIVQEAGDTSNHGTPRSEVVTSPKIFSHVSAPQEQLERFSSVDWVNMYLEQELDNDLAQASTATCSPALDEALRVPSIDCFHGSHAASLAKAIPKCRRKAQRKPRRKDESQVFTSAGTADVLFGRGGESYQHCGNIAYRATIEHFRPKYKEIPEKEKERKTELSWEVVRVVQESGGRFLEWDSLVSKWYVVDGREARRKVAQALREKNRKNKL